MAKPVQAAKKASYPTRKPAPGQSPLGKKKKRNDSQWLLFGLVGAAVVIVIGLILLQQQALNKPAPVASGQLSEGMAWGPADAPVKIVEYSNFGCSHCRDFAQKEEVRLRQEYEPIGKVRFEFRPFSLGSQAPDDAANAAACAADQQRFWDYHDLLFAKQGLSADTFGKSSLKAYGQQLGLDAAKFDACVDAGAHADTVRLASQQGQAQGVNATPTFFVNNVRITGAVPYEEFKAKVDSALQAASAG